MRKLLAWKTNKEASGEWPAYIFMHTDYIPNRKEPLKISLAVANSEADAEAMVLFDEEVADKIKKKAGRQHERRTEQREASAAGQVLR